MHHPAIHFAAFPAAVLSALTALAALAGCRSEGQLTAEQKRKQIEIHTETAQQYLAMGEVDRAEGQALKGLELDPSNEKLKLIRGWTLQRRGRPVDVLAAEVIFREIEPGGDYRATLGLAEALERKGVAYQEASQDMRSGRRVTDAPDPQARADELAGEAQRAWHESLTKYEKTLVERPTNLDSLNGLARVHALLGQRELSLTFAERLIETLEADLEFWREKLKRPEISEAEEQRFRRLVRQQTDLQIAARLLAAQALYHEQRYEEAALHLDAALALDPERTAVLAHRAEVRRQLGRYEEAIADIDAYLKRSTQPFDHPDVKRAWRLRTECEERLRERRLGAQTMR